MFARTLAMGIVCRFDTGKADDKRVDHSGNRGYGIQVAISRFWNPTAQRLPDKRIPMLEGVPKVCPSLRDSVQSPQR